MDFAVSLAENQRLRGSAFAQGKVFLWRYGCYLRTARSSNSWRTTGIAGITQEREWPDSGAGATGSGKSTTLAAMVGYLNNMPMRIF